MLINPDLAKSLVEELDNEDEGLMNTINFPDNMRKLNEKLPKPKYEGNHLTKCATTKNI